MDFKRSVSVFAFMAAGAVAAGARAQVVTTGAPTTISLSSDNVLNLLGPYLGLNATSVGQATLTANLARSIAINNSATPILQQLAESDENLLNSPNPTSNALRTAPVTGANAFGIAANLGGGLPNQAAPAGGTVTPSQPVGGLGAVLGQAYVAGVTASTATTGPLNAVVTLLNNGYNNLTSPNLGVAKNYFANGAASNNTTTLVSSPALAPAGGPALPTGPNGLPNQTSSVYDMAYGVTNTGAGQDVFGSSRPVQVAPGSLNFFDPTALNGLATNPSFPSGHSTYAYTDSILLAMLVPQEYQSMLYRASAYANSRIVLGVHYPLDIIASRALAGYDLSQAFTNAAYINNAATTGTAINLPANYTAASTQITPYLTAASATCGGTVTACANSAANTANDPYAVSAAAAAAYTANLTYGLPILTLAQAPREAAPAGGPDASILLSPIYGGNTAAATTIAPNGDVAGTLQTSTINQIIVNTETNALAAFYGTSLSYWTRIDLAAAAGYFGNVTGTLSLAASDVVNTAVTVGAGGVLDANGTLKAATIVGGTGTLTGSGTVAGVAVNAGGVLAPGSLAAQAALAAGAAGLGGTRLAVNGNISFAPGSTLALVATPTQVTSVVATGTATLTGANVSVQLPTSGPFVTSKNNLILQGAAGGVTGTFAGVATNLLFATPTLSYDPNTNVFLSFGTPNFAVAAATPNQAAVANGLSAAAASNPNGQVVAALATFAPGQAGQAQAIFNALSGEGLIAAQNLAHREVSEFTSSIFDQTTFYGGGGSANAITLTAPQPGGVLALAPGDGAKVQPLRELADLPASRPQFIAPGPVAPTRTWRAWATGFGGEETLQGNGAAGVAGQSNAVYGGSLGVDYQVTPGALVGVAVGGSNGTFDVGGRATSGSTTGAHVALYDLFTLGHFYGASSVGGSFFDNTTTRTVAGFGGLAGETERGRFGSQEVRTRVEAGRPIAGGGAGVFTPFVAVEAASLRSGGFSEANLNGPTVLGLAVQGQSSASVPGFVGARYQGTLSLGNGMVLTPSLQAAYVHEFSPQRTEVGALTSLPGSVFLVEGARPSYNAAQVKAGAELAIGPRSAIFGTFDGEFSGQNQFYGGKGGFRYLF